MNDKRYALYNNEPIIPLVWQAICCLADIDSEVKKESNPRDRNSLLPPIRPKIEIGLSDIDDIMSELDVVWGFMMSSCTRSTE